MMNFTEWNNRDEPQGLEGIKKRLLDEARRKAAPMKVFKDPNAVDPKVAERAKALAADAAKTPVHSVLPTVVPAPTRWYVW